MEDSPPMTLRTATTVFPNQLLGQLQSKGFEILVRAGGGEVLHEDEGIGNFYVEKIVENVNFLLLHLQQQYPCNWSSQSTPPINLLYDLMLSGHGTLTLVPSILLLPENSSCL